MTTQTSSKSLGKAIRKVRLLRGLTSQELSKTAFCGKQDDISQIESGKSVSTAALKRIAKALGVPLDCLRMLSHFNVGKKNNATRLIESLQRTIIVILKAETELRKRESKI